MSLFVKDWNIPACVDWSEDLKVQNISPNFPVCLSNRNIILWLYCVAVLSFFVEIIPAWSVGVS